MRIFPPTCGLFRIDVVLSRAPSSRLVLPVAQRLADMFAGNGVALTEVRDGSRHAQDAMICSRRQMKRLRTLDEKPTSIRGNVPAQEERPAGGVRVARHPS